MKILLIGASGQLGADLLRNNIAHTVDAPQSSVLNLSKPDQFIDYIRSTRPEIVINCAAFHNLPLCEDDPSQAFQINCLAVQHLAAICNEINSWLVTFSTDYVFNGNNRTPYLEDDLPGPLQIYGITRLAGEYAAISNAPENSIVIRTCGLYGITGASSRGGNFVDKCVELARNNDEFDMGCDQTVTPTSTQSLSKAVFALIESPLRRPGIYHLVNEGECTWHEFAVAIVELLGLKTKVNPVDRKGLTGSMRRPIYSALSSNKALKMGIELVPWHSALKTYINTKYK